MLRFGVADWLLEVLQRLTADTQQYELQYGLALMMNLTLHKLGQKLFSRAKIDVLLVLKKHFESIQEIQLETCLNGTIYCLMSVPMMKERARKMGLREFLAERFRASENQQVKTQIDHIFDKMDEEDEEIWQQNHRSGQH